MVEEATKEEHSITIDGDEFDSANLSAQAIAQLDNINFVNEQILQKNNELQIADSARIVYISNIKKEIREANT